MLSTMDWACQRFENAGARLTKRQFAYGYICIYWSSHESRKRIVKQTARTSENYEKANYVGGKAPSPMALAWHAYSLVSLSDEINSVLTTHSMYHYPEPKKLTTFSLQDTETYPTLVAITNSHILTTLTTRLYKFAMEGKFRIMNAGYTNMHQRHYSFCVTHVIKQQYLLRYV